MVAVLLFFVTSVCSQDNRQAPADYALPISLQGVSKMPNGDRLRYSYHFDHTAFRDCRRVGNHLIALVEPGNLLRFDAESLRMTAQVIVPGRAIAMTLDHDGRLLVGTETGEIAEVDPATMELKTVVQLEGSVGWLATAAIKGRGRMMVAAVSPTNRDGGRYIWPGESEQHGSARSKARAYRSFVAVFENGQERRLQWRGPGGPMFLDESGRLWMGSDVGEWGGSCAYLNLRTGKTRVLSKQMDGVSGFFRSGDGRIIVYGGTSHMMDWGFIAVVKNNRLNYLRRFETKFRLPGKDHGEPAGLLPEAIEDPLSPIPDGKIELMASDLPSQGFWVVHDNVLYHTNSDLSQWTRTGDLGYRWRKHVNGMERTARRLILDETRPQDLIVVMTHGGFVRISQNRVQLLTSSGQLEAFSANDIWQTSLGTLFVDGDEVHSSWLLADGRWLELRACPKSAPGQQDTDGSFWGVGEPFAIEGASIVSFCEVGVGLVGVGGSMDRYLVQTNASGSAEMSEPWQDSSFTIAFLMTAHGKLLRIAENKLWIREGANWREAGQNNVQLDRYGPGAPQRVFFWPRGRRFISLGTLNEREIYLDAELGDFLELDKAAGDSFEFGPLKNPAGPTPSAVFDAVDDGSGWLLVASGPGLFRFHPEDGALVSIPGPKPPIEIVSLCRDGQGRLWAASHAQIYVSSDEGKSWEEVALPMLFSTFVARIRRSAQNPQGIVLARWDSIVFLEW